MSSGRDPFGLFLASDSRAQYAEDIVTALALPEGAVLQLRYDDQYLSDELRRSCASGEVVGTRSLISFMSSIGSGRHYLVPVRFCRVVDASALGGIWVFRVSMDTYPALDDWPRDSESLEAQGRRLQLTLGDPDDPSFVFASHTCPLVVDSGDNDAHAWSQIARRLSLVPTFGAHCYFLKVALPTEINGSGPLAADASGSFELSEDKNYRLAVSYWAAAHDAEDQRDLEVSAWGEALDVVSPVQIPLKSRYDGSEVLFRSLSVSAPSMCRIDLAVSQSTAGGPPLAVGAKLALRVSSSRRRVLVRVCVSALAALLLAVPSMLGPSTPVGLRIALAGLGAVALGITSSGTGTWGKR